MANTLTHVTVRLLIASFMVFASSPLWAQAEQEEASVAPESGAWVGLLFVIVLFGAVCAGCFVSPKRTHQD